MAWQDGFASAGGPAFDAETERERRLALQAKAGAEWALTALIARYQPSVSRYLTRLCGNQALALSLAERVFERMERRLHGPQGGDQLRLWLLRASTEAGLEALRRPRRASAQRLPGPDFAGLLPSQAGAESLRKGMDHIRSVAGAISRQARPLVWAESQGNEASHAATSGAHGAYSARGARGAAGAALDGDNPGASGAHLDPTLDALDPREALRHRLVRATLAELPYGDAQCLALHLVAGLNQAEVAQALGITNRATRRRIVQGLALFSEKYAHAVEVYGLPPELGYGEAAPANEPEPEPAQQVAPAPVVVPASAEEARNPAAYADEFAVASAPTDRLAPSEALSGVAYRLADEDGPDAFPPEMVTLEPAIPQGPAAHQRGAEAMGDREMSGAAAVRVAVQTAPDPDVDVAHEPPQSATQPLNRARYSTPLIAPTAPTTPSAPDDQADMGGETPVVTPPSGGAITRIASDAIIGPVVDALPVAPASPSLLAYGLPGPRSTPLAYEVSSEAPADNPSTLTFNLLEDGSLMTPLTFETEVLPAWLVDGAHDGDASATPDAPLEYEIAPVNDTPLDDTPGVTLRPDESAPEAATADDTTLDLEAAVERLERLEPEEPEEPLADDAGGLAAVSFQAEPIIVPVLSREAESAVDEQPQASTSSEPPAARAAVAAARPPVITRSLEDLWNEIPNDVA